MQICHSFQSRNNYRCCWQIYWIAYSYENSQPLTHGESKLNRHTLISPIKPEVDRSPTDGSVDNDDEREDLDDDGDGGDDREHDALEICEYNETDVDLGAEEQLFIVRNIE